MSTEYCRHIRPSGARCRAYALRGKVRCFWHTSLYERHLALNAPPLDGPPVFTGPNGLALNPIPSEDYPLRPFELNFPELEDRSSIQLAISMLLGALARNLIDPRRAGSLLYGLQVASSNARGLTDHETYMVRSASIDENGQSLAPDEDPEEIIEAELFLEDYEADQKKLEEDDEYESKYDDPDEPFTLRPEPRK